MGENYKRKLLYDPLEQYIPTSYSRSDTTATESYIGNKEVVDFLLAREAYHKNERRTT